MLEPTTGGACGGFCDANADSPAGSSRISAATACDGDREFASGRVAACVRFTSVAFSNPGCCDASNCGKLFGCCESECHPSVPAALGDGVASSRIDTDSRLFADDCTVAAIAGTSRMRTRAAQSDQYRTTALRR